jgi:uroporphyrinogen-III decarboxylase
MTLSGADLFNVDHLVNFALAKEVYGKAKKAYKGNLDPVNDMLFSSPEDCQRKALDCIGKAKGTKYILGAGCEVPEAVTDEVFRAFCEAPIVFAGF